MLATGGPLGHPVASVGLGAPFHRESKVLTTTADYGVGKRISGTRIQSAQRSQSSKASAGKLCDPPRISIGMQVTKQPAYANTSAIDLSPQRARTVV